MPALTTDSPAVTIPIPSCDVQSKVSAIAVEPAVQQFLRESEAFGSSF